MFFFLVLRRDDVILVEYCICKIMLSLCVSRERFLWQFCVTLIDQSLNGVFG